ncbi:uncharacterized protein PIG-X [Drosophila virilis]|uniref:Phosphatidylinositol-glycan biosynthesis class X protein n=1 Tax=Drosophila virilis TaxID=7244 RepID=B4MDZ9_DROVI|nr:uncharacterized protein LOC6635879 [Drosophila virilis]EDW58764.2 uncharacterized protein Dvir_GJ18420 [Drosophila virilis]
MKCFKYATFVAFNVIAALLLSGVCCFLQQQPTIRIEMDEAGMHRKLKYTVQFDNTFANSNCVYMLAQPLPAAVYVSTDELDGLQRLKMLDAVYPKFVDVEIITEKAEPFSVLLRGTPKITDTLTLPIHFRYHAASRNYTSATVVLGALQLYLSCPMGDKELIDTELLDGPDKFYCLGEHKTDFEEQSKQLTADNCNWRRVKADFQTERPLHAEIPVGDANDYIFVLYATIALTWTASIWTILSTRSVARRINEELTEQHLQMQLEDKVN